MWFSSVWSLLLAFGAAVAPPAPPRFTMVARDLDGDGIADIAVATSYAESGHIRVFRGSASALYPRIGTPIDPPFASEIARLELPFAPDLLAAGDFDGDGAPELATAETGSRLILTYALDDLGRLSPRRTIPTPAPVADLRSRSLEDGRDVLVSHLHRDGSSNSVFIAAPIGVAPLGIDSFASSKMGGPSANLLVNGDAIADYVSLAPDGTPTVRLSHPAATFVVTTTADSGPGSLRDAIDRANAGAGVDLISFAIGTGVATIAPLSPLPSITDPVTIDGTTQPGDDRVRIVLDGRSAGSGHGLHVTAGFSRIRGIAIGGFPGHQLFVEGAGQNIIDGNHLGVSATGDTAAPGGFSGLAIVDSRENTIGGANALAGNVISGNAFHGIVTSGAASVGNVISANFIGTNASGTAAVANRLNGVWIQQSPDTVIGGTSAGAGNIVSGNGATGILVSGTTSGVLVQGNFVGIDVDGSSAIPNGLGGVTLSTDDGAGSITDCVVGGAAASARNIASGNTLHGIMLAGAATTRCDVQGNYAGLDATGAFAIPNGAGGIRVFRGAFANTVGGSIPGTRNVCSGNTLSGIGMEMAGDDNVVTGNYLGVDASGENAVPNGLNGIYVEGNRTIVGGAGAGEGNVIAGNNFPNVIIWKSANGTVVLGNRIGVSASGQPIPGRSIGIQVADGARNSRIGGIADGEANVIANNRLGGVVIVNASGQAIRGNSITGNGLLGIDLGFDGGTENDPLDADSGPNSLQNAPVITAALAGASTTVRGVLASSASGSFAVDVYANESCNRSGSGEGARYLGTVDVVTDASGDGAFELTLAESLAVGTIVTATATSAAGDTSEFSTCVRVALAWDAPPAPSAADPFPAPTNLRLEDTPSQVERPSAPGAVAGYRVYRAKQQPVSTTAENLFTTVPPTQTSAPVAADSGGSFFVVTAVYDNGESAGSNSAEGGAPPSVDGSTLTVKSKKVTIASTGVVPGGILFFADGIPFVQAARVKRGGTLVVQKGPLLTGQSIGEYIASKPVDQVLGVRVLVFAFRGPTGGVVSVQYLP